MILRKKNGLLVLQEKSVLNVEQQFLDTRSAVTLLVD
jgi:hypothetical protein